MRWRLFAIALFNMVLIAACGALVFQEKVTEDDAKTVAEQKQQDPLRSLKYTAAERASNMAQYGFEEAEVKEIVKLIEALDDQYGVRLRPKDNRVVAIIDQSDDQDGLIRAICGTNNTLPIRYAAMQYLIGVKSEQRNAIDLQSVTALAPQDWFTGSRVTQMYEVADLSKERKPDTPRMIIAAVLAQDEELFVNQRTPYGAGLLSGWSWADAKELHKGINKRVFSYVALMHLVFEVASAEEGLCSD